MKTFIVSNQQEITDLQLAQLEENRHLATISNTGLPEGKFRITFLPSSVFVTNSIIEDDASLEQLDVRDWIKLMDEGHSADKAAEMAKAYLRQKKEMDKAIKQINAGDFEDISNLED